MKQNLFEFASSSLYSVMCTGLTFLFGAWDVPLVALLVFIALDYITGVACAIIKKELSSRIGGAGLLKKALIMVIIIAAVLLDRLLETQWVIRSAACCFYIANEGISILENAASIGLPVPQKLVGALKQLEKDNSEADIPDSGEDKDKNKDGGDTE